MITVSRDKDTVNSFVESMIESMKFFAKGRIPEDEIRNIAEYKVNRLDFNNEWQMHKGIGYFAMMAVNEYLAK
ncbi:MAG: hypothetical protein PHX08_22785 [Lachnospiraceae bacterium]|nr:hypothetical protein [Lachnospiraceae bacterium]